MAPLHEVGGLVDEAVRETHRYSHIEFEAALEAAFRFLGGGLFGEGDAEFRVTLREAVVIRDWLTPHGLARLFQAVCYVTSLFIQTKNL